MTKCPNCKVGNFTVSGSHQFCDKCGLVLFVMTGEYIEECAKLVAILVSNTKFVTKEAFEQGISNLIATHVPMLDQWLATVAQGLDAFMHDIRNTIMTHAVNLQLPYLKTAEQFMDEFIAQDDKVISINKNKANILPDITIDGYLFAYGMFDRQTHISAKDEHICILESEPTTYKSAEAYREACQTWVDKQTLE